jgi:hypothetical protein
MVGGNSTEVAGEAQRYHESLVAWELPGLLPSGSTLKRELQS